MPNRSSLRVVHALARIAPVVAALAAAALAVLAVVGSPHGANAQGLGDVIRDGDPFRW